MLKKNPAKPGIPNMRALVEASFSFRDILDTPLETHDGTAALLLKH